MQTLVQVLCSNGVSLRDAVVHHPRLERYQLQVTEQKRPNRSPGWAKIHGLDREIPGAINLHWEDQAGMLICRVVTRGRSDPGIIIGYFVAFLLRHFRRRIQTITVVPR